MYLWAYDVYFRTRLATSSHSTRITINSCEMDFFTDILLGSRKEEFQAIICIQCHNYMNPHYNPFDVIHSTCDTRYYVIYDIECGTSYQAHHCDTRPAISRLLGFLIGDYDFLRECFEGGLIKDLGFLLTNDDHEKRFTRHGTPL